MEVHHHPHVERKGFKEYFLEFLMIFLAVTLGFFAENIRESISNHKTEKEYMKSMLVDIEKDTAHFNNSIKIFSNISKNVDSLALLLRDNNDMNRNAQKIYEKEMSLYLFNVAVYTNHTIQQLKSSGNFRLIRNAKVVDSILFYDGLVQNYVVGMEDGYVGKRLEKVRDAKDAIFKTSVAKGFIQWVYEHKGMDSYKIELPDQPYFLTTDKKQIEIFINLLDEYTISINWFIKNIERAIKAGTQLDLLIRKEYGLRSKNTN